MASRPSLYPSPSTSSSFSRVRVGSSRTVTRAFRTCTVTRCSAATCPDASRGAGSGRIRSASSTVPSARRRIRTSAPSTSTRPGRQWPPSIEQRPKSSRTRAALSQGSPVSCGEPISRLTRRIPPSKPTESPSRATRRPLRASSLATTSRRAQPVGAIRTTSSQSSGGIKNSPQIIRTYQRHRRKAMGIHPPFLSRGTLRPCPVPVSQAMRTIPQGGHPRKKSMIRKAQTRRLHAEGSHTERTLISRSKTMMTRRELLGSVTFGLGCSFAGRDSLAGQPPRKKGGGCPRDARL